MARKFGNANFTHEELSEFGKRGQQARMETLRKRKEMKETLKILMAMSVGKGKRVDIENIQAFTEIKGKNITVDQAMMVKLVQRALTGDLNAITMVRDTIGEKPSDKVEVKDVTPVIISGEDDLSE